MQESAKELNCFRMPETNLNNAGQEKAIHFGPGPMLVLAGPGSGKTYTITRRIQCLIEEKGVAPDSILVITFTKAAAQEMKNRFRSLSQGKNYPVSFGTFHAVFYHILKTTYHYRSGSILSEFEKKEILRSILIRLQESDCDEEELESLISQISKFKNDPKEFTQDQMRLYHPNFAMILQRYQQEIARRKKMDFDDMILNCKRLFMDTPEVLSAWQKKFRYILIDEFQDINSHQYEIIKMMAVPENNLFVVGDDDQAIYSFRGSRPEYMRQFLLDFADAEQVTLSVNYRSTAEIVTASNQLITKNRNRIAKKMCSGKKEQGNIQCKGCENRDVQTRYVIDSAEMDFRQNKSAAIIFRTNQEAGIFAAQLSGRNIPFSVKEKLSSPYSHPVCRDLISYLSYVFEGKKRQDFYRIMNKPVRYLSGKYFQGDVIEPVYLKSLYHDVSYMKPILRKLELDIARMEKMDLFAAVNYVRKGIGYDEWLQKTNQEGMKEAEWFQEQVRAFRKFSDLQKDIMNLEEKLRRECKAEENAENAVQLLTMHASKGLEFDSVYIPNCNEGITPHKMSISNEQIEEERRMFYVAMTRAKEKLTFSWIAGTKKEPGMLSRFLSDLGLDTYQFSPSISSSNSQLSRYSSNASATASYSSSSSM